MGGPGMAESNKGADGEILLHPMGQENRSQAGQATPPITPTRTGAMGSATVFGSLG